MESKLLKKLLLSCAIAVAFYCSGHLAMLTENWHDSVLTSSAVFGVSFISLITGTIKAYIDFFT